MCTSIFYSTCLLVTNNHNTIALIKTQFCTVVNLLVFQNTQITPKSSWFNNLTIDVDNDRIYVSISSMFAY